MICNVIFFIFISGAYRGSSIVAIIQASIANSTKDKKIKLYEITIRLGKGNVFDASQPAPGNNTGRGSGVSAGQFTTSMCIVAALLEPSFVMPLQQRTGPKAIYIYIYICVYICIYMAVSHLLSCLKTPVATKARPGLARPAHF